VDDGLPSNQVNCLYQDSIGRLWIGTDAGIAIFDGTSFEIINKQEGLASNDVRAITQDERGNFWFACYDGGLTKFDGKKFVSYTKENGLHGNFIRRLYYSKTYKTLFVGANDGFYTYKGGRFEYFGKANGKLSQDCIVLGFLEGRDFIYVLPFKYNLMKYYPATETVSIVKDDPIDTLTWRNITSVFVTSKGDTIWGNRFNVVGRNGMKRLQTKNRGNVYNMCEDSQGNAWFPIFGSVNYGILRYDGVNLENLSSSFGLDDIKLNYVAFDKNTSTLWLATDRKGLIKVPRNSFIQFELSKIAPGAHEFRKLYDFNGIKHIVFKDQVVRMTPDGSVNSIPVSFITQYPPLKRVLDKLPVDSRWHKPEFNEMAKDTAGNLWLGSAKGIFRLSTDERQITHSIVFDKYFRWGTIAFDSNDDLYNWGYWEDTLAIIRQPNQFPTPDFSKYTMADVSLPREITRMLPVGKGMLFSSLYGGLFLSDSKSFTHLNKTCPTLSDHVSDICQDLNGNIVYCTNTGEIGIGSLPDGTFNLKYHLDSLNPVYGRNFIWLVCDKKNNLYVGTNKGMLLVNLPKLYSDGTRETRFFTNAEGYSDYSVTSPIVDVGGNVWVASQNTLIKIDTKSIISSTAGKSIIVLTSLETTDSTYCFSSIPDAVVPAQNETGWVFPYHSNNLTFHFNCVNLLNPDKDQFSIKLDGFDKSFKNIGSDRKITYTNLPAGRYTFQVRVYNLNTLQEQTQTIFKFKIKTPYWQTWWFIAVCFAILVGMAILFYYWRLNRVRKAALTKLEIAELEMQALQSQMNPHFIFNVFNSLQRYILERDAHKGVRLLSDFSNMIRQTFTLSSKKVITLQEEITYLNSYLKLEQERFVGKFQFEIVADPDLILSETMLPSMLIQPLVENAVKHGLSPMEGTNGLLKVIFSKAGEKALKCIIEDNGIGLERSLAQKRETSTRLSKALSITQRRIELFSKTSKTGKYSVTMKDRGELSPKAPGTIVEIIMPI
jgi:ligand-binding sensor domain-containing protein